MDHPKDYWNVDGVPRIVGGFFFIVVGALQLFNRNGRWPLLESVAMYGFAWFVLKGGLNDIAERFKTKITYPRTGYVDSLGKTSPPETRAPLSMQRPTTSRLARTISAMRRRRSDLVVLIILIAVIIASWAGLTERTPGFWVAGGVVGAILVLHESRRRKDGLKWTLPIGYIVIGIVLERWGLASQLRFPAWWLAIGSLTMLEGTIVLFLYIRRNPMPQAS